MFKISIHHSEDEHEDNNFSDSNKSQSFSRFTDADKITEITGIAKDNFSKYGYGQPLDNARGPGGTGGNGG